MKYISLFSGVGGFELAFDNQGFENVLSCEIDKYARQTFHANFDHTFPYDVTALKAKDIPQHDVLTAGFPCQAFSISGKRQGFDDARGTLIFYVFKILESHKPEGILLENVKGLVSHNNGETLAFILEQLRILGYHIHHKILNSKDFGVPQNRQRLFIVGFRDIKKFKSFRWPSPPCTPTCINDILEENVDEKYFIKGNQEFYRHKTRVFEPKDKRINTLSKNYGKDSGEALIRLGHLGNGGQGERIYSPEGVSVTLSALGGGRGAKTGLYLVEDRIRKLTPRECFRLQGFPDSFILPCSDAQLYKQAGNSVTVPVVSMLALSIKKSLLI